MEQEKNSFSFILGLSVQSIVDGVANPAIEQIRDSKVQGIVVDSAFKCAKKVMNYEYVYVSAVADQNTSTFWFLFPSIIVENMSAYRWLFSKIKDECSGIPYVIPFPFTFAIGFHAILPDSKIAVCSIDYQLTGDITTYDIDNSKIDFDLAGIGSGARLFFDNAMKNHPLQYGFSRVISRFTNVHEKGVITCAYHGHFSSRLNDFAGGAAGCPVCCRSSGSRWTTETWIMLAKSLFGDVCIYDRVVYKGKNEPVEIGCRKHGHYYLQKPNNHTAGTSKGGCKKCIAESKKK